MSNNNLELIFIVHVLTYSISRLYLIGLSVSKKEFFIIVRLLDELESLGISVKKINDLNDNYELENLIENIKQTGIQDYKTCYSQTSNYRNETSLGSRDLDILV